MKTKPKRIRALKRFVTADDVVWPTAWKGSTEPCYILRQSDVRALIQQMNDDFYFNFHDDEAKCGCMQYALKRAGITPGKGAK